MEHCASAQIQTPQHVIRQIDMLDEISSSESYHLLNQANEQVKRGGGEMDSAF